MRGIHRRAVHGREQPRNQFAGARQEQFDPRRSRPLRRLEGARPALPQLRQHAFHMLAGTQAVDPVVGAAARVQRLIERADLHIIHAAAGGPDTEAAEVRQVALQRLDLADLGSATPTPPLDLLGVARQPADHGRCTIGGRPGVLAAPHGDRMRAVRAGKLWLHVQHGGCLAFESRLPNVGGC